MPEPARSAVQSSKDERAIVFTVPLVFRTTILGDILIRVRSGDEPEIQSKSLLTEMKPLLNDPGNAKLYEAIDGRDYVSRSDLQPFGFDIEFDRSRLSLTVLSLPIELQATRDIGSDQTSTLNQLPVIQPAGFSSYLNIVSNGEYSSDEGMGDPDIFLSGATRIGDFVFEYDGAITGQFGEGYKFYRRGVRAIYDRPAQFQRLAAGDLRVFSTPLLGTAFLGGLSIEKRRRIFDPFTPTAKLAGQEILLDSSSTVDVIVNGERVRSLQLDAGSYNLTDLPVELGANDVLLSIRDSAGREQVIALDYFFEPLELAAGETEYVLSVGALARNLGFEPTYSDKLGLVAMYRKGLSDKLVLGGALQASKDLQVAALSASWVPQFIPGAFDVQLGGSAGDSGTGVAVRASYRYQASRAFERPRQLSISLDYQSANFRTIADVIPVNFNLLNVGATYSQGFSDATYINVGASYTYTSGPARDRATLFADVFHRLNRRTRIFAGVEFGTSSQSVSNFGARIGLSISFGGRMRASADYRSRNKFFRANLSRSSEDVVGSFGFDLGISDGPGQSEVDATFDYASNRFEARAIATTEGRAFGSLDDRQNLRLQLGTSIAFAGGSLGIGRPIGDSFAIVHPHEAIKDVSIITGRSLSQNRYDAKSGWLGGAVQGDLTSYARQDIQYDTGELTPGIDIGDGSALVNPPYRAGYDVEVGSAYFVSATGFLANDNGPVALAVGTVADPLDPEFQPIRFFTNSAGRFALIGLAPGRTYTVKLDTTGESFSIEVPQKPENLLRLGTVNLDDERNGSER